MAQAIGSKAQVLIRKEAAYGTTPVSTADSVLLPINTCALTGSRNQTAPVTIRGSRNPVMPIRGNLDAKGSIVGPVDIRNIGYVLQMMLGDPNTTQDAAKSINNGGVAVDVGGGVVGIPVTTHGFVAGETVTIAATTNYNGAHPVLPSSTASQVNITASYIAETFGSDDTIRASRYTHVFKVPTAAPSFVIEKGFTDIGQYFLYNGVKADKISFKLSGDGEFTYSMDMVGAKETLSQTSMDSTPTSLAFSRLNLPDITVLKEGGSTSTILQELEVAIANNLDSSVFVLGGGGIRGALPEGLVNVTGMIKALFTDAVLLTKALNDTETSLQVTLSSSEISAWSLDLTIHELKYKLQSPDVSSPGGVYMSLSYEGYYSNDAAQSAIVATLINDVSTYAWA